LARGAFLGVDGDEVHSAFGRIRNLLFLICATTTAANNQKSAIGEKKSVESCSLLLRTSGRLWSRQPEIEQQKRNMTFLKSLDFDLLEHLSL
jgi:hypothetical protein